LKKGVGFLEKEFQEMGERMPLSVLCLYFDEDALQSLEHFAEFSYQFSPRVGVRKSDAVFLDFKGTSRLYDLEAIKKKIQEDITALGLLCQFGEGRTASEALVRAKFAIPSGSPFPLRALFDFIHPFGAGDAAKRRVFELESKLTQLGLTCLSEVRAIPKDQFFLRFGKQSNSILLSLEDPDSISWQLYVPQEKMIEEISLLSHESLSPCSDVGALLFLIKRLISNLCMRLELKLQKVHRLTLELELDLKSSSEERSRERSRSWELQFPFALSSPQKIFIFMKEKLENDLSRHPLRHSAVLLRLTASETVFAPGSSESFLPEAEKGGEDDWKNLIQSLCARLSKNQIFFFTKTGKHLPEETWRRIFPEDPSILKRDCLSNQILGPERPSRLLSEPLKLKVDPPWVSLPGTAGKGFHLRQLALPEKIYAEWWKQEFSVSPEGFRQYFKVCLNSGEVLWVFSLVQENRRAFYLQGYFD
jgi:hypothetical protein